jgi:V/A-type H+-transporting ATPase subunit F
MRFELISDNTDTLVGMRLAGITGVIAHTPDEVRKALNNAVEKDDVAIILITEKLVKLCEKFVYELKSTCKKPLIVEIPGENPSGGKKDSITRYIRDAIGLKI